MGFLDNLFGASDNTTTTKVEFPQWVEDASKANYGVAADIASRPYTAYPWERIAGFTGDQKDAMGFLRDMAPGVFKGAGKFDVPRMIDPIGKGGSGGAMAQQITSLPPLLAMKDLRFGFCHAREIRRIAGKNPVRIDAAQRRLKPGAEPVNAVLHEAVVLGFRQPTLRCHALKGTVHHGPGFASLLVVTD